jgi:hypothetical protein
MVHTPDLIVIKLFFFDTQSDPFSCQVFSVKPNICGLYITS